MVQRPEPHRTIDDLFPSVPGSALLSPADRATLLDEGLAYVERRARHSPVLFLAMITLLGVATDYPVAHPRPYFTFVSLLCLAAAFRSFAQRALRTRPQWGYLLRLRLFVTGIFATALVWAGFSLTTSALYGDDWVAFNTHATLVFAAIATVFAYGPLLRTAMSLTLVLLSPALCGLFFLETESAPFYAVAAVVFCAAFLPLLPRLHHEYWTSAINARRIQLQAEELERAKEVAERASAAKSDFLATMSHEIRTPLSGILGAGALLLRLPLGQEQRDHASTVQRSAQDLLRLIDELLDAARLDRGRVAFQRQPFEPAQLVRDATRLFEASAKQEGLLLHARVHPEVPSTWMGDAGRIKQVVTNLVSNAVKFTAAGSVVVEVAPARAGAALRFSVTDTGRGVSPSQRARLFHRFQQADDSIYSRYGGSGLGLAISQELVRAMGGELCLESEEGKGARFWFELPELPRVSIEEEAPLDDAVVTALPAPEPLPLGSPSHAPSLRDDSPLVLLADDDPVLRKVLGLMLRRAGCRVIDADDGKKAVTLAKAQAFELIFLDCQMPELGGLEATRSIRAVGLNRFTPVVGMSANNSSQLREECLHGGMCELLYKPIGVDTVAGLVRQLLPKPTVPSSILAPPSAAAKASPPTVVRSA